MYKRLDEVDIYKPGLVIKVTCLVSDIRRAKFKNKPGEYGEFSLRCEKVTVRKAIKWSMNDDLWNMKGKVVDVDLAVSVYGDGMNYIIDAITENTSTDRLLLIESIDVSKNWDTLNDIIEMLLQNEDRAICQVCSDLIKKYAKKFREAPAAVKMHHDYKGGLLEHTLGVVQVATAKANADDTLDGVLIITSAILHDIGKIYEYDIDEETGGPIKLAKGELIGHCIMGCTMVDRESQKIKTSLSERDKQDLLLLRHIIASHHGRYEYGAPVIPMIREAVVVHNADMLDSSDARYKSKIAEIRSEGEVLRDYTNSFYKAFSYDVKEVDS